MMRSYHIAALLVLAAAPLVQAERRFSASLEGEILRAQVVGISEETGAAQILVTGTLTPNSKAQLAQVLWSGRDRVLVPGPEVRSNSYGEFAGAIELDAGLTLESLLLFDGNVLLDQKAVGLSHFEPGVLTPPQ